MYKEKAPRKQFECTPKQEMSKLSPIVEFFPRKKEAEPIRFDYFNMV